MIHELVEDRFRLLDGPSPVRLTAERALARADGMPAPNGSTPRSFRLSFVRRDLARSALETIRRVRVERVVVRHGRPVERAAAAFLERAFGWLACDRKR